MRFPLLPVFPLLRRVCVTTKLERDDNGGYHSYWIRARGATFFICASIYCQVSGVLHLIAEIFTVTKSRQIEKHPTVPFVSFSEHYQAALNTDQAWPSSGKEHTTHGNPIKRASAILLNELIERAYRLSIQITELSWQLSHRDL